MEPNKKRLRASIYIQDTSGEQVTLFKDHVCMVRTKTVEGIPFTQIYLSGGQVFTTALDHHKQIALIEWSNEPD
ncbi:TPA: hypothetical protein ACOEHG_004838 [Enterobacter ludwigii]